MASLRMLAVHSPGHKYSQAQLASTLSSFVERAGGGSTRWTETIHSLFRNTKIDSRFLLLDPAGVSSPRKAEEVMPSLLKQNTDILAEVITNKLKSCSLKPSDIDTVFFSSPLFSAPALSVRVMNSVPGFRSDVKHWPLMGLGCVGGVALLSRASDYLRAYPKQTAITLTVESGSRFWHGTLNNALSRLLKQEKQDKEKIIQQILLGALFGDAISCSVVHGAQSPLRNKENKSTDLHTEIVDYESYLLPDSTDLVSHHCEESGIQSYLSPRLGKHAPKAMADTVDKLLQRNNLKKTDIGHWFVHAGGPKMLKYFETEYGLNNGQLKHCWSALSEVGNISSATVPRSYEIAQENEKGNFAGKYGMMVAAGPGLTIEALLLKWA